MKKTITENVLKEQDNLVLAFPTVSTQDITRVDISVFRVALSNWLFYEYDKLPFMEPGDKLEPNRVGRHGHQSDPTIDNPGDSIFHIESDRPLYVYHFAVGMKPDGFRLYVENPAGNNVDGFQYEIGSNVNSQFGYYPSELMGYEDPSLITEQFAIEGVSLHMGIRNAGDHGAKPMMNIVGKTYELIPITDEQMIRDIVARRIPATIKTFGAMKSRGVSLPKSWPKRTRVWGERLNQLMEK